LAYTFFFKGKTFVRKGGVNGQTLQKILRKSRGAIPKFSVFIGQTSIFCRYSIQNVKDGSQIRVYTTNKESEAHFSQFISGKVKKISCSISGQVKKIDAHAK